MRRTLTILVLVLSALAVYAYVGQIFSYQGVQYRITAEGNQLGGHFQVEIEHYDTAYVVIPDSVPHNGHLYQVRHSTPFWPGYCSLDHYIKVDYSRMQYNFIANYEGGKFSSTQIDVDTLILPPFIQIFDCRTLDSLAPDLGVHEYEELSEPCELNMSRPMAGVHHVFSTCTIGSPVYYLSPSIVEMDISSYPAKKLAQDFQHLYHLQRIKLPETVTEFQDFMFIGDRNLQFMNIPDSLEVIKTDVFSDMIMDTLYLGVRFKRFEIGTFSRWSTLRWIEVDPQNPYFMNDFEGCLLSKSERTFFHYPAGRDNEMYELPPVDTIGPYAFSSHNRHPIPSDCFGSIEPFNRNLKILYVTPSLQFIDGSAFAYSGIEFIPNFYECQIKHLGSSIFENTALQMLILPPSVELIGGRSYYTKVVDWESEDIRPDSVVVQIMTKDGCFLDCNQLKEVDFSYARQLKGIGRYTFCRCTSLGSLDLLPCDNVTVIHRGLCQSDSALSYVALPHRVSKIYDHAFSGCVALRDVICPSPIPLLIDSSVFEGVNKNTCTLHVPDASVSLYQRAPVWQEFFNIVGNGMKGISVSSSDSTMGTVVGGGGYSPGEQLTISATPHAGYEFIGWSDGVTANPRTVTVTRDSSIVAIFQPIEYLIDAHSNDTTLGTVSGAGYYHLNDTVILSANIFDDARFTGWSDGFRYPVRDLVVTQDCTLIANFEHYHIGPDAVHVTVQSEDPIKGSTIGSGTYPLGDTASVAGIANAGYVFKGWDDGNINNPRHVPLTQDTLFIALFRLATDTADTMATPRYHLKAIPYDSTMGSVSGSGRYEEGTVVEITATPFEGYRITGWNIELTVEPTLIFTMPDRPVTIIAYFEPIDDALPATPADPNDPDASAPSYNILGQPVDDTYHGIVIRNGKKVLQ